MNSQDHTHPTLANYLTGLGLAVALTAIPFGLVAARAATRPVLLAVVAGTGLTQALVHLRYFLHLTFDRSERGKLFILIFATLLILIMGSGTIVVMNNLNMRMM